MKNKDGVSGGRRNRWPLSLDTNDAEQIASFSLSLGYDDDDVVNTLVARCNLDVITAKRIVADVASQLPGGTA